MSDHNLIKRAARVAFDAASTAGARDAIMALLSESSWRDAELGEEPAPERGPLSLHRASVRHPWCERELARTLRALRRLASATEAENSAAGSVLAAEALRQASAALGWQKLAAGILSLERQEPDPSSRARGEELEAWSSRLEAALTGAERRDHRLILSLALRLPALPPPAGGSGGQTELSDDQAEALVEMLHSRDPAYNAAVLARFEARAGIPRVARALVGRSTSVLEEDSDTHQGEDAEVTTGIRFDPARNAYVAAQVAEIQSWQFHLRLRQLLDWEIDDLIVAREELEQRLREAAEDPDNGEPLVEADRIAALVAALVDAAPATDEELRGLLDAPIPLQFSAADGGDVPQSVAWQLYPQLLRDLFVAMEDPAGRLFEVAQRQRAAVEADRERKLAALGPVLARHQGVPKRHSRCHWALVNLANAGQSVAEMTQEGGVLPHSQTLLTPAIARVRFAESTRLKLRFVLNDNLDINTLSDEEYWLAVNALGFPPNHEMLSTARPIVASGYLTFDHGKIVGIEDDGVMITGKLPPDLPPMLEVVEAFGYDIDQEEVARSALALDWGAFARCAEQDDLPEIAAATTPDEMRHRLVGSTYADRPPLAVAFLRHLIAEQDRVHPGLARSARVRAAATSAEEALHGFCLINVGAGALARGELPKGAERIDGVLAPFLVSKVIG